MNTISRIGDTDLTEADLPIAAALLGDEVVAVEEEDSDVTGRYLRPHVPGRPSRMSFLDA